MAHVAPAAKPKKSRLANPIAKEEQLLNQETAVVHCLINKVAPYTYFYKVLTEPVAKAKGIAPSSLSSLISTIKGRIAKARTKKKQEDIGRGVVAQEGGAGQQQEDDVYTEDEARTEFRNEKVMRALMQCQSSTLYPDEQLMLLVWVRAKAVMRMPTNNTDIMVYARKILRLSGRVTDEAKIDKMCKGHWLSGFKASHGRDVWSKIGHPASQQHVHCKSFTRQHRRVQGLL